MCSFDGTCVHFHITCSQWTPVTKDPDTHTHSKLSFFPAFYFSLLRDLKDVRLPLWFGHFWKYGSRSLKLWRNVSWRLNKYRFPEISSFLKEWAFQKLLFQSRSAWLLMTSHSLSDKTLNFFSLSPEHKFHKSEIRRLLKKMSWDWDCRHTVIAIS